MKSIVTKISLHKYTIILFGILLFHIFFRFYNLEKWASFDWDQVNNAWAAIRILLVQKYPLIGMVAKMNSGIYIGPLYYYLVALFYFITQLNPIASPLLAACTAMGSFFVVYYVSKRLFNEQVGVLSCFIYTFSIYIIQSERTQWPVNFIAPLSLLIFYYLYKVISGEVRFLIHLSVCVGLSFQIHFTSIFYPIIILLTVPLFPRNKLTLKYIGISILLFMLFFLPQIFYYLQTRNQEDAGKYVSYIQTYYHGFHAQRVLQLVHDAFIEFYAIVENPFRFIGDFVGFVVPLFFFALFRKEKLAKSVRLSYLTTLWIIVPWFVFSTYRGEISNYYFSIQLYVAIIIFGYLTYRIFNNKYVILHLCVSILWIYFAYTNITAFSQMQEGSYIKNKTVVEKAILEGRSIPFTEGNPQSYLYFYFTYIKKHTFAYQM